MKKKHIIPIVLLLTACSANDTLPTTDVDPEASIAVPFSASIGGNSTSRSENEDDYLHNNFIYEKDGRKSRIRIVNTVNYSAPDFQTEGAYKEYEYNGNKEDIWDDDEINVNFVAYNNNGFVWNDIRPTSANFVFEAACYPMEYEYFSKIETDQREKENFWKADLLLAHHAQSLEQRYDLVKLKFHHVFAMVHIKMDLPISGPGTPGGFPEDAIQGVKLVDMQTGYTTDYNAAINNDGLRTVIASGDKADIQMFCLKKEEPVGSGTEQTQHYEYCAIVPAQSIAPTEGEEKRIFVQFEILTYPGTIDEEENPDPAEPKTYVFRPTETIDLSQEHITILTLRFEEAAAETILLHAEVANWTNAWTDLPMQPVEEGNQEKEEDSAQ